MSDFSPARRLRLTDQVVLQLKEQLASGAIRVGDKLPSEPELMARFKVGRTTIREAIRAIAHEGMLEVRQGDGTYVRALVPETGRLAERLAQARVLEIYEVRRGLELETSRLAAVRRDDGDLTVMEGLLARLQEAVARSDMDAFLEADIELHQALAAATKNPLLVDIYGSFAKNLRGAIAEVISLPGVMEACVSRHERLLAALRRRDAEAAESISAQYLERVAGALAAVAAQQPADRAS